jgi:hypothetical protein
MNMTEDRLAAIEAKLQRLTDIQDIRDCIARHARGCDRHDAACNASAFHDGGVHELGNRVFAGADYGAHSNAGLAMMFDATIHTPVLQSCEIDGDVAHAESYVIGVMLHKDDGTGGAKTSQVVAGRYIDRLERRDGRWGIMVRRVTVEIVVEGTAAIMASEPFKAQHYLKGNRDRNDLSYARPLGLQEADRLTP